MSVLTSLYATHFEYFCMGKRFLVYNLVARNLKAKYHRSILGVLWTLLSPLGMACIYYFVFAIILQVKVAYYPVFIVCGILPWTFFSQSVLEGMESIVNNWGIVTKVPVPIQIFPYVGAITNLVTLGLSIPIIVGGAVFMGAPLGPSIVLLPFYFGLLFLLAYALSIALSVAFVYFRDLRHLLGIVMQMWLYATPVFYAEAMIPSEYQWLLYVNPVGGIFSGIHDIVVRGLWPEPTLLLSAIAWSVSMVTLTMIFRRFFVTGLVEQI